MFECETEGVEFVYSITTPANTANQTGNNVDMPHTNTVSVYAKKAGYMNSDVATEDIDVRGMKGNVNTDGEVNVGDIVSVCNVMAGISTVDPQLADVNSDGEVNVGDIVTICNIMAGNDE